MSEVTGTAKVHEAYAFCCMRCGYGWEQSYEIEHHADGTGQAYVVYKSDGVRVPSPLKNPTCVNCGGHVVRIMRAGQVASVRNLMDNPAPRPAKKPLPAAAPVQAEGDSAEPAEQGKPAEPHHWHLSDLLQPFHRK